MLLVIFIRIGTKQVMGQGNCCELKESSEEHRPYIPQRSPLTIHRSSPVIFRERRSTIPKSLDPQYVDCLVRQTLEIIGSLVDNEQDSPISIVKLHLIADNEEGWLQVVTSMVNVIPLHNPLGPLVITLLLDDCPLPTKESISKIPVVFNLTSERAMIGESDVTHERNMCVVLGCIAEKLAGPNSMALLTDTTLEYLIACMKNESHPSLVLFALIALEKFSQTTENKVTIKKRLLIEDVHPVIALEKWLHNIDFMWRQVGFCANWSLDNLFTLEDRGYSYQKTDMSNINAILNINDVSEYLKISPDGLEARCDSYSFESVRCTCQVDDGVWYYEITVVTSGVMQVGWATKNSHFLNQDGYGIGDDVYSLAFDGCRKLIWHNAQSTSLEISPWKPGDVVGCLIDLQKLEAIFSVNGDRLEPCTKLFDTVRTGFFAAASFMAFQQCRFNFGSSPFLFPPTDREFSTLNSHSELTPEQKIVIPRHIYLEELRRTSVNENSCHLCFDKLADITLLPCQHKGFCSLCTAQLKECPMCRATIEDTLQDLNAGINVESNDVD